MIGRETKFELLRGCPNLVITLGDSWTWGDSLGIIDIHHGVPDDLEARKRDCYGRHLADAYDADWINDAKPGGSNQDIVNKISEYVNSIDYSKYKKIYLVATLTETGREFGYTNGLDFTNFNQQLARQEQDILDRINQLVSSYPINLIVGRNFTDYFPETKLYAWCLTKTWVEVILENLKENHPATIWNKIPHDLIKVTGMASGVGLNPLSKRYNNDAKFKKYFVDTITAAEKLWQFLELSPYNKKLTTKHPTKEAHLLWAQYILNHE